MAGMRRRDFIAAVGSTAVAWPLRTRSRANGCGASARYERSRERSGRARRIAAFLQRLQELDWEEGWHERIASEYISFAGELPLSHAKLPRQSNSAKSMGLCTIWLWP